MTHIAASDSRFADFRPYVACCGGDGRVAFTATLRDGRSGVFLGDGVGACDAVCVAPCGDVAAFVSHPALDARGGVSVYASLAGGGTAVVVVRDGKVATIAARGARFTEIGPLGPTMNAAGVVAFRAVETDGTAGVYAGTPEGIACIASAREGVTEFHGLPVIDPHGMVAVRATMRDGREVVLYGRGDAPASVAVSTDAGFRALSPFVSVRGDGTIGFGAVAAHGDAGAFAARRARLFTLAAPDGAFATPCAALLADRGHFAIVGTAPDGDISVFAGGRRVLGVGDTFEGARIVEIAANPVSINAGGALAVRVLCDEGRQAIVRLD